MGRYYNGSIEGKFWFAVQPSDAASRFGGEMFEPQYISYSFDESHLEGVEEELKNIEEKLGDKLQRLDEFFESGSGYRDEQLKDIGINNEDLSDYADYGLGVQIRDCIIENGYCNFDAEL